MNHELTAIPELNAIETTVAALSAEIQSATGDFIADAGALDAATVSAREGQRMQRLADQCDATIAEVVRAQRRFRRPKADRTDSRRLSSVRRYLSTAKRDLRESAEVMRLITAACEAARPAA